MEECLGEISDFIYWGYVFVYRSKLEETKEKQKLREKPKGISIAELAIGKKISIEEEVAAVGIIDI